MLLCCAAGLASLPALAVEHFVTPDDAGDALVTAIAHRDRAALERLFGPQYGDFFDLGPGDAARQRIGRFVAQYRESHVWRDVSPQRKVLKTGADNWPFAIPLVATHGQWQFDPAAGRDELLNREIGANELSTIEALKELQLAQSEYFRRNPDRSPIPHYAGRIDSHPDTRDGLYWPGGEGDAASPIGPLFARAARDMAGKDKPARPFFGYYYRLLDRQGKDAPGGAYSYLVRGQLYGGYAVIAWPADYGKSGVMTFITSHDGRIYQRNLGAHTGEAVRAIDSFNPDSDWEPVSRP
ncbi:hypothetical protein GCM10007350_18290 [Jeongeupia chitinilytica]|uniref:DUF2950 domain-containing protein n=2 Tax=Jeongeupia chitinilytica TaxID=1041641 RepID=A0ABQ3GZ76_9NEIS|nr:hypothetical protein GCM10007350_18290 [Jeongeupia chitinilytica]